MSFTTNGSDWYLMRASGVVTLVLLTAVFVLGIATTTRWRARRLPSFAAVSLHRSISLLAVVFLGVHIVTALVDPYAAVGLGCGGRPVRRRQERVLGRPRRRLARPDAGADRDQPAAPSPEPARSGAASTGLAYLSWPLALFHSLGMGSDTGTLWLRTIAACCVASVVAAVAWRLRRASGPDKHLEPRGVQPA